MALSAAGFVFDSGAIRYAAGRLLLPRCQHQAHVFPTAWYIIAAISYEICNAGAHLNGHVER
jgi:hypothetical protein